MDFSTSLSLLTLPVMTSWLTMLFAPRWRGTRWFLNSDAVPLLIAVIYGAIVLPQASTAMESFRTFEGIMRLFTEPAFVFAGWIHYLAFDLIVGRVVLADAQRRGIPHLAVVPSLVGTFMFGPFGYLLYALTRLAFGRAREPVAPLPAADLAQGRAS